MKAASEDAVLGKYVGYTEDQVCVCGGGGVRVCVRVCACVCVCVCVPAPCVYMCLREAFLIHRLCQVTLLVTQGQPSLMLGQALPSMTTLSSLSPGQ